MSMVNAFSREDFERLSEADRALIARREKVLGPAYRLFYEKPLHLVRGEGVFLYDAAGEKYLDAYNNVASLPVQVNIAWLRVSGKVAVSASA